MKMTMREHAKYVGWWAIIRSEILYYPRAFYRLVKHQKWIQYQVWEPQMQAAKLSYWVKLIAKRQCRLHWLV